MVMDFWISVVVADPRCHSFGDFSAEFEGENKRIPKEIKSDMS